MSYRPGDIFYQQFGVTNVSGAAINADSTPTANLVKNGVYDLTPKVFVTNVDLGIYTLSGIIPSTYTKGYSVGVVASGLVGGALTKVPVSLGVLDTLFVGDLPGTPGLTVSVTGSAPSTFQVTLASGGVDTIMIENNLNLRQAIAIDTAVLAGSSVVNGNNITYYALNNNTITRVQSTAISGARQAIVVFLP